MSGRTPIYDFDEWSRSHYGATFERSNRARKKYAEKVAKKERDKNDMKTENLLILACTILFMIIILTYARDSSMGYDQVTLPEKIVDKNHNKNVK